MQIKHHFHNVSAGYEPFVASFFYSDYVAEAKLQNQLLHQIKIKNKLSQQVEDNVNHTVCFSTQSPDLNTYATAEAIDLTLNEGKNDVNSFLAVEYVT